MYCVQVYFVGSQYFLLQGKMTSVLGYYTPQFDMWAPTFLGTYKVHSPSSEKE